MMRRNNLFITPLRRMVILVAMMGVVASCRPLNFLYVEPKGPPEYKLGWQDGCDSGLSSHSGFMYKILYGFRKRPEFGNNSLYKSAWNEGFSYCRFSLDNKLP